MVSMLSVAKKVHALLSDNTKNVGQLQPQENDNTNCVINMKDISDEEEIVACLRNW